MSAYRLELRWRILRKFVSDTYLRNRGTLHSPCLDSFQEDIRAALPQIILMLRDPDSNVRSSGADMITELAAHCEWRMGRELDVLLSIGNSCVPSRHTGHDSTTCLIAEGPRVTSLAVKSSCAGENRGNG